MKLLLILGVVLVHSNIALGVTGYDNAGIEFVAFVSGGLALVSVPSFFIVSGYLFFLGVDRFTPALYGSKLHRRVRTLLVPYVLWNIFCALLFIVKVRVLGFDGLGIIAPDGSINTLRFLEGFLMIPQNEYFPFAFAFWFVRNLMCFVVLSPLIYLIARKWSLTVLAIAAGLVANVSLGDVEYFCIGACLALHGYDLRRLRLSGWRFVAVVAVYVLSAVAIHVQLSGSLYLTMRCILILSGFTVILNAVLRMPRFGSTRFGSIMIGATFFIYAFHQCFCRIVRKAWVAVIGDESTITALVSYAMSFLTMVAVSVGVWLLMRRYAPRLLAILTGNR